MNNWLPYLEAYLAIGVVVVAVMWVSSRLREKRPSPWVREVMEELRPERKTLRYRLLSNWVAPALTAVLVCAMWPVALFAVVQKRWLEWRHTQWLEEVKNEPRFKPEHLLTVLTIEEIERLEMVEDPLQAVPAVPFGHLHERWAEFKSELQPSDTVWSLEKDESGSLDESHKVRGYAVLRGEEVGPWMLVEA